MVHRKAAIQRPVLTCYTSGSSLANYVFPIPSFIVPLSVLTNGISECSPPPVSQSLQ